MNRKQRRAALKQGPRPAASRTGSAGDPASQLFARSRAATAATQARRRRARLQAPAAAQARPRQGQQQSRPRVAGARQAQRSLRVFCAGADADAAIVRAVQRRLPNARRGIAADRRSHAAGARGLAEPADGGSTAWRRRSCRDLRRTPCCSACCSRFRPATPGSNSSSRRCAPRCSPTPATPSDDDALAFCCALAKQCFINEYVFATTPDEDAQVERLQSRARRRPTHPARRSRRLRSRRLRCIGRCHSLPDAAGAARSSTGRRPSMRW